MAAPSATLSVPERLRQLNWWVVLLVTTLAGFGLLVLYSAAGGSFEPWAANQAIRFAVFLVVMLFLATRNLSTLLAAAYPAYAVILLLLVAVEVVGAVGGGSQRWIGAGPFRLQPSELMKLTIVLALARYYHFLPRVYVGSLQHLLVPAGLVLAPMALVLLQPDLGTALLIALGGMGVLFLAGVRAWIFGAGAAVVAAAMPIVWSLMLPYQKRRVMTFLDPSIDPRGAGYHITQSKIAIGSGGVTGKGFMDGTQSNLDFLPEMHTDFIFAILVEEWGFLGGGLVLLLFGLLFFWGFRVADNSRSQFGRLAAGGLTWGIFLYVAINMAMVMGLAPVVGVPLPLISYGGSAMMTVMFAFGMLLCISLHRRDELLRPG